MPMSWSWPPNQWVEKPRRERKAKKFDFSGEDSLVDKMIVHLDVLCSGVEEGVLRKLDVAEVGIVYHCWLGHLYMQIL